MTSVADHGACIYPDMAMVVCKLADQRELEQVRFLRVSSILFREYNYTV